MLCACNELSGDLSSSSQSVIEQRLVCFGVQWRHVYKSLLLLEFMSKRGPMVGAFWAGCTARDSDYGVAVIQRVVEYLRASQPMLNRLNETFEYKDENGRDQVTLNSSLVGPKPCPILIPTAGDKCA